jgi:hypothetical protein
LIRSGIIDLITDIAFNYLLSQKVRIFYTRRLIVFGGRDHAKGSFFDICVLHKEIDRYKWEAVPMRPSETAPSKTDFTNIESKSGHVALLKAH